MILAQALTDQSSTAKHTVGTVYTDPTTGYEYLYCKDSGSAIAQYHPAAVTYAGSATELTVTNGLTASAIVVPQIAVTASYYFWGLKKGAGTVHTASAAASATPLFVISGVTGRIDDAEAAANLPLQGIQLTAVAATAAASANTACWLNNPKVVEDSATRSLAYSG